MNFGDVDMMKTICWNLSDFKWGMIVSASWAGLSM